jgi:hypothetical protein
MGIENKQNKMKRCIREDGGGGLGGCGGGGVLCVGMCVFINRGLLQCKSLMNIKKGYPTIIILRHSVYLDMSSTMGSYFTILRRNNTLIVSVK